MNNTSPTLNQVTDSSRQLSPCVKSNMHNLTKWLTQPVSILDVNINSITYKLCSIIRHRIIMLLNTWPNGRGDMVHLKEVISKEI